MIAGNWTFAMPIDATVALSALPYALSYGSRALAAEGVARRALEALLGPQRAAILLQLDAPRSAGEIARALRIAPGGGTHHVQRLEAAGLVARMRRGRHVMVERTARGTALLTLYGQP